MNQTKKAKVDIATAGRFLSILGDEYQCSLKQNLNHTPKDEEQQQELLVSMLLKAESESYEFLF